MAHQHGSTRGLAAGVVATAFTLVEKIAAWDVPPPCKKRRRGEYYINGYGMHALHLHVISSSAEGDRLLRIESVLAHTENPVVVVSSMGKQSTGKSCDS